VHADWYQTLDDTLSRAGALTDAAECHGNLCGMLCGDPSPDPAPWIEQTLGDAEADERVLGDARGVLGRLYDETRRIFEERGTEFEPLLPPDEDALEYRVQELVLWCQGFLFGLGASRVGTIEELPGNSREIVHDLLEMTRTGMEVGSEGEDEEAAYAEVVEYLRVGVLLVYEELCSQPSGSVDQQWLH